jgi:uncharacterized protein (DUF58 family)
MTVERPVVRTTFEGRVFFLFASGFALAALGLGENLVFLMTCLALGAGLVARRLARRNLVGLEIVRETPSRARVGEPTRLVYRLRNAGPGSAIGIEVEDVRGGAARPHRLTVSVPGLAGGAEARASAEVVFTRRGHHRLPGLVATSAFPLGFHRATRALGDAARVLVRPARGRATALLRARLRGEAASRTRPSLRERGDDVLHGVREFREGDDPRRIHWRSTARRGTVTLSEWRREQGREVVILLGRSHGAGHGDVAAFERAVSFAATAFEATRREGLPARLLLGAPGERTGGERDLGRGLDALARVRGQGARRPRAALKSLGRSERGRFVLYVAAGEEPGIERRLAASCGRGGSWLCVRADLPSSARWVRGLP